LGFGRLQFSPFLLRALVDESSFKNSIKNK
jgi:hypothetical protein